MYEFIYFTANFGSEEAGGYISRSNAINKALGANVNIWSSTGSRGGGAMNVRNVEVGFH